MNLIEGPYDESAIPVMSLDNLESRQIKVATGGFAFIWRWFFNLWPKFDTNNREGTISFKFKVHDVDWEHRSSLVLATFKEQDVSYVTNSQLEKWLIEVNAGNTMVKAQVLGDTGSFGFLTWEVNPQD